METDSGASAELQLALERLRAGGLVAYPTETVWGLGALSELPVAIERLVAFKGRREGHPMSILIPAEDPLTTLCALGAVVGAEARQLISSHWPGPLTLVLPRVRRTGGTAGTIGVRCSPHPIAGALASLLAAEPSRVPRVMTSTSCNRGGQAPATCRAEAERICGEEPGAPWVVGGRTERDEAGGEAPSTVLDLTGGTPRLLRPGAIAKNQLRIRRES